jgi:tRNA U34 5-methylaminomethyl-2-thiouridine-forming methyltransferase MnmC
MQTVNRFDRLVGIEKVDPVVGSARAAVGVEISADPSTAAQHRFFAAAGVAVAALAIISVAVCTFHSSTNPDPYSDEFKEQAAQAAQAQAQAQAAAAAQVSNAAQVASKSSHGSGHARRRHMLAIGPRSSSHRH